MEKSGFQNFKPDVDNLLFEIDKSETNKKQEIKQRREEDEINEEIFDNPNKQMKD